MATKQARVERRAEEKRTASEIRALHTERHGVHGVPRVHAKLWAGWRRANQPQARHPVDVWINHIVGRHLRTKKRTTMADRTAPDPVMRGFTADASNTG
nr:hypothetical protein [Streptomyces prasinopilosus]